MGLFAVMQLAVAYRLVHAPHHAALDLSSLQSQVELLLASFRYGWNFSLVVFGIHLLLLGLAITIVGLYWIADQLQPYLYPSVSLDAFFVVAFAELLLPLWLVIMGWRIRMPQEATKTGA